MPVQKKSAAQLGMKMQKPCYWNRLRNISELFKQLAPAPLDAESVFFGGDY